MAACPQHTFQVLTKRPERAREFFAAMEARPGMIPHASVRDLALALARMFPPAQQPDPIMKAIVRLAADDAFPPPWPLPNVWLGVSVEDQATADERIPELLRCPAAVRFVSYEPALAAVDFRWWLKPRYYAMGVQGQDPIPALDWLIVGGESGHGARPLDVAWVRTTRDQCEAAETPLFFKQCGANVIDSTGLNVNVEAGGWWPSGVRCHVGESFEAPRHIQLRSRKGGEPAEWPADLRVRMFPGEAWPGRHESPATEAP
jgi:protein gp37